mmetsp:Transcript_43917/g.131639  ORF Transcript_43917/g.131639 Transcript_43917/m.131639 type:complete len:111 (-) Transcript_43917:975-1307(-)
MHTRVSKLRRVTLCPASDLLSGCRAQRAIAKRTLHALGDWIHQGAAVQQEPSAQQRVELKQHGAQHDEQTPTGFYNSNVARDIIGDDEHDQGANVLMVIMPNPMRIQHDV